MKQKMLLAADKKMKAKAHKASEAAAAESSGDAVDATAAENNGHNGHHGDHALDADVQEMFDLCGFVTTRNVDGSLTMTQSVQPTLYN